MFANARSQGLVLLTWLPGTPAAGTPSLTYSSLPLTPLLPWNHLPSRGTRVSFVRSRFAAGRCDTFPSRLAAFDGVSNSDHF